MKKLTLIFLVLFLVSVLIGCGGGGGGGSSSDTSTSSSSSSTSSSSNSSGGSGDEILLSGSGWLVTEKFTLKQGLFISKVQCTPSGEERLFEIDLVSPKGGGYTLFCDTINEPKIVEKVGQIYSEGEYYFHIRVKDDWQIGLRQPVPTSGKKPPFTINGTGQKVTDFLDLGPGTVNFHFTHSGAESFAIGLFDDQGQVIKVLVDAEGNYDDYISYDFDSQGYYLIHINTQGEGNWVIEVK